MFKAAGSERFSLSFQRGMMYPGMKVRIEEGAAGDEALFESSFQVLIVRVTSCFENSLIVCFLGCESSIA